MTKSINIQIYVGSSVMATDWKPQDTTWEKLIEKLANPVRKSHTMEYLKRLKQSDRQAAGRLKDVGGFVPAVFNCDTGRRQEKDLVSRTMIALDIESADKATVTTDIFDKLDTIKYECFYHTTHGHTPEAPRIRLLFPMSESVTNNEYRHVSRRLAQNLKLVRITDEASYKPNQLMFWSSVCSDGEFRSNHIEGNILNPISLLDNFVESQTRDLTPPEENEGLIGEFCREYDIVRVIEEFLNDVYEPGDYPDKYTFSKSTSNSPNGVHVFPDSKGTANQFVFCYNNSDKANDEHCHNSFDLLKIHKCKGNVKKALQMVKKILGKDDTDYTDDWDDEFVRINENTGEITPVLCKNNFKRALRLKGADSIRLNLMTGDIELLGEEINFDHQMANFKDYCNRHRMLGVTSGSIREYTHNLAFESQYHPVKDYMESLEILESTTEFEKLINTIKFTKEENKDFYTKLIKKWLISGVAALYDRNFTSDGFIVFQGSQGCGKSSFYREINPVDGAFLSEFGDFNPKDKDSLRKATKYWLTELAEIKGTFKSDRDALKSFITSEYDEYRRAYHMSDTKKKRQTFFGGTVNDSQFLKDETGDRRFWVIPVDSIDWRTIRNSIDLDKLWGEARGWHINKESYRLEEDERELLNNLNLEFKVKTNIESLILEYIDLDATKEESKYYMLPQLFSILNEQLQGNRELTEINIGKALTNAGYEKERPYLMINGKKKRKPAYRVKLKLDSLPFKSVEEAKKEPYKTPVAQNKEKYKAIKLYIDRAEGEEPQVMQYGEVEINLNEQDTAEIMGFVFLDTKDNVVVPHFKDKRVYEAALNNLTFRRVRYFTPGENYWATFCEAKQVKFGE